MKIEFKEKKTVVFDSLAMGQTFIDPEYDDGSILMVVEPAIDVQLTTDKEDDVKYVGYAVDLSNGVIIGYESDEEVVPVNATLTAERY